MLIHHTAIVMKVKLQTKRTCVCSTTISSSCSGSNGCMVASKPIKLTDVSRAGNLEHVEEVGHFKTILFLLFFFNQKIAHQSEIIPRCKATEKTFFQQWLS